MIKRLTDILKEIENDFLKAISGQKPVEIYRIYAGIGNDEVGVTPWYTKAVIKDVERDIKRKGYKILKIEKRKGDDIKEADSPTERTRRYNRKNKAKVRAYLKKTQDDRVARNGDRRKAEKKHGKAKIKNKDIHHPNGPKNGNYKIVKKDHGPDKKNEHASNEAIAMSNVSRDMRNTVKGVEKLPADTQKWLMGLIDRYSPNGHLPVHRLGGWDLGFIRGVLQAAERSGGEDLTKIRYVRSVLGTAAD